jgi:hypothetical protein
MGTSTRPASEFLGIPFVKDHIASASQVVGKYAAEEFWEEMDQRIKMNAEVGVPGKVSDPLVFDSPLELTFWIWWLAVRKIDRFCRSDIDLQRHVPVTARGKKYVLDFVLAQAQRHAASEAKQWPKIGVELDGHAFHEKTTE